MENMSGFVLALNFQAQAAEQASSGGLNPLITAAVFLFMLVILVFVHELGHLLVALWMGIDVDEFGIGIPPRACTLFVHRGVKYTLNWVPLGGFVRFSGEGDNAVYGTGSLGAAPPWRRIPVLVAGPLMNLLLAMVIFGVVFAFVGFPTPGGQHIATIYPGTPAAEAGFQEGDVLVELAGQDVLQLDAISSTARANEGQPIEAVVLREGQETSLTVTPGPWEATAEDGSAISSEVGFGFSYFPEREYVAVNPFRALVLGVTSTFETLGLMIYGLTQMIGGLLGTNEPPPGGIAGPVGIARATGEVLESGGLLGFWNWMALLSINLFLLNLLPIPALDGSHIVFAVLEWVRGKKVPPEKEALVHGIGFATLMGLILLISISDIWNAIQGQPVLGQ